jgi:predicted RNase H-like nuclease (RuvC/YqgF family)
MTKDEMKNRISMALKDPILQQGFEIICKNLAELEKYIQKKKFIIDQLNVQLAEFEKENAELNKKLSKAEEEYDKMFWNKNEIISKAKETIRMLVDSYNHKERFSFEKDLIKAEQFLQEVAK